MGNILLTGASGDIGLAVAEKFAAEGHNLALFGNKNFDLLCKKAEEIKLSYGTRISLHRCDASDFTAVRREVQNAEAALGTADLLINNAGISVVGLDQDLTETDWLNICGANLSSAMYFCRSVVPSMLRRKSGRIINISSVWGVRGASCEAAYSATKGGLNAYTKALAKELAPSRISVNALALGAVNTKMNSRLSADEKAALEEEIPFGRMAETKETAEMVYCLFTAPSYLTGQVIGFDGGW